MLNNNYVKNILMFLNIFKVITQKKNINIDALKSPVPMLNVADNLVGTTDAKSLEDNKYEL